MRQISACVLLSALMIGPATADFPRSGIPDIPAGAAAPFTGDWSMAYAADENTVAAPQLWTCDKPVALQALDDSHIRYASPKGSAEMELTAFEGRTTWLPTDNGPTSIAVWLSEDRFLLYMTDGMGKANWDFPYLYERCPAQP